MSAPSDELIPRDAAQRFACMPLSVLIAEWDERLPESERPLLAKELQARGYRVNSLAKPTGDIPDCEAELHWERRSVLNQPLQERPARFGAVACCAITTGLFVAPGAHLGSVFLGVLYLAFGIAVQRRSRLAALAALFVLGLHAFGFTLLLLYLGSLGWPEAWAWAVAGVLLLVAIVRIVAFLLRPPVHLRQAGRPSG